MMCLPQVDLQRLELCWLIVNLSLLGLKFAQQLIVLGTEVYLSSFDHLDVFPRVFQSCHVVEMILHFLGHDFFELISLSFDRINDSGKLLVEITAAGHGLFSVASEAW
jgi:hypothetical protein